VLSARGIEQHVRLRREMCDLESLRPALTQVSGKQRSGPEDIQNDECDEEGHDSQLIAGTASTEPVEAVPQASLDQPGIGQETEPRGRAQRDHDRRLLASQKLDDSECRQEHAEDKWATEHEALCSHGWSGPVRRRRCRSRHRRTGSEPTRVKHEGTDEGSRRQECYERLQATRRRGPSLALTAGRLVFLSTNCSRSRHAGPDQMRTSVQVAVGPLVRDTGEVPSLNKQGGIPLADVADAVIELLQAPQLGAQ
jgi:hypothetical protein